MKHRLERVREVIKRELGGIIQRELSFGASLVTVSGVDITPDLRQAHIFISAIGNDAQKREALEKLEAHRAVLQHELSRRVIIKYTPILHFRLDESIERGVRVIELMDKLGLGEASIAEQDGEEETE